MKPKRNQHKLTAYYLLLDGMMILESFFASIVVRLRGLRFKLATRMKEYLDTHE